MKNADDMTAVIFKDIGEYQIVKKPIPRIIKPKDLLVKVLIASICGTDVHILDNPPKIPAEKGIILGHEFVGEVLETGSDVTAFKVGDRLICDNNIPCDVCPMCLSGNRNLCMNMHSMGVHVDGIFSQYAVVPEKMCVGISDDIPLETAIFAEPLNCVMGAIDKIRMLPGENVLVLGGGPIGLYFAKLLKINGAAKVIVSEVSEYRSKFASQIGADRVINPSKENLYKEVLRETCNIGADVVVDAVGTLVNDAINCVRPAGKVMIFGLNNSMRQTVSEYDIAAKSIQIYGNFVGNFTLLSTAKLLESGLIDIQNLITHKLSLTQFGAGMEAMRKGKAMEVVLYPFDLT
ncbi:MAG: alcohol dehydrogenase catalytic domain-containing protein [Clostridium sp.]|jgi:threonine dehydrogenase-like Zn-dependent dehydrogenase|uniref:alcohol dehydrogenase catalytic domain-containing protein n=1 Tax=Clostridium sp. TaxID=1506 RepID=UPI0025C12155|nr:alcohol dehydrogenase catalytic domain-containing protein [Clostridium sp.]MCH3964802.1 alcohol dehydrogenase catalytic domain-containing protein [Clostridium sp.]MCI1715273.1 alcohol dehydrogenase catalytic domain-containing protein [Clostridium sp.]MCI1799535.1 alcohol dehydrogenase catalytic domain-containing protein [Clostridium sp.]MCI1813456.1 alcohol dehydrogenase catalytic domain-containing protein [Clostridium sp.]MCI1870347.1 alcohol dehydrogenase catalytic domain-containing prote